MPPAAVRPSPLFQITTAVATVALIAAGAFIYRLMHPPLAPLMALEVNIGAEQPMIGMAGPSTIISPDGPRIATPGTPNISFGRVPSISPPLPCSMRYRC